MEKKFEEIYTQGTYLENNPTWHSEDSGWKAKQILKMIERNSLQPSSVCEVGCGSGEILNQLYFQMPEDVTFAGYEISSQAFKLCQEKEKDRLKYYLSDVILDENAFFDILLCIDVFEHVEDYLGFLRNLRNKSQYKIFHIPLDISVISVLRREKLLMERQKLGHIQYFTKETGLATLQDTGYEIIDYFYTANSIELQAKSWMNLLAKFPRKIMYYLNKDMAVRLLGGYSLLVLTK
jgi:hypothetical protein